MPGNSACLVEGLAVQFVMFVVSTRQIADLLVCIFRLDRRDLHENPETMWEEHETGKYIMGVLDKLGISYQVRGSYPR